MKRFELSDGEKLLCEKRRAYWKNIKHVGNFGTLYLTDKRVVFCATAGWKLLLFGQIFDSFIKSGNIRWEASHKQVGSIKGTGSHAKIHFLTLDGENTNVAADDDFIDLLNQLND